MRKLRVLIVLFFVAVTSFFVVYKIKNVAIKDVEAPVITSEQDVLEVSIQAEEKDLLEGLRAQDNRDGDVTDSLVVVSKSKFIDKGRIRVNYAAFDKKSNVGTFSREVVYTDYTSPHFTLNAPLRFNVENEVGSLLNIIEVQDCLDGNISGLIKMKYDDGEYVINKDESSVGNYGLTFQVTNSAGDTARLPVQLEFLSEEDYKKPAPALTEYVVYTRLGEQVDYSQYLSGVSYSGSFQEFEDQTTDEFGNSVKNGYGRNDVSINSDVDYNTPGVYTVSYTLQGENEFGDTQNMGSTTLYVVVEE